jgi:Holliday junction resolvase
MANKNYVRGYTKEVACADFLRENGYWVERFYASKGTFDVLAVGQSTVRLIQVKRSKRFIKSKEAVENAYSEDLAKMHEAIKRRTGINERLLCELWVWFDKSKDSKGKVVWEGGWRKFVLACSGKFTEVH